ncbi:MAG: hypothetical protein ABIQ09_01320 [Jatrophihabitantaceae bacterium]
MMEKDVVAGPGECADQEITLAVVGEGLVCLGDRTVVDDYIARIQTVSRRSWQDLGITTQSLTDLGAAASTLAAFHAEAGQYFRMSPESLAMFRESALVPGADGYFKVVARNNRGQFAGNYDLQSVTFDAQQAMSLQLAMATASLRAAIKDVAKAIERVEGKVDRLVALANAQMLGQVIGQHRALEHHTSRLDAKGSMPATDWESVASMGPKLVHGIETLRQFLREQVRALDPSKPAPERANALRTAIADNRLGEVLQLLVLAEDSHYLWQRLRIERARVTEPANVENVVESAQQQLQEDMHLDGVMLRDLRDALMDYATLRPLEIHRRWSGIKLEGDVQQFRSDLDEFVAARRMQITSWPEFQRPTIRDWGRQVQEQTVEAGRAAKGAGAKAIDKSEEYARRASGAIEQQARGAAETARNALSNRKK